MANIEETELFQLFGSFFHQDYDLMIDVDENVALIKQLSQAYVTGSTKENLDKAIKGLRLVVDRQFPEDYLESTIYEELGINIDPEFYGYTYQEFLNDVLRNLISLSETELVNSGYTHNEKESNLQTKEPKNQTTQDDLAYFKPCIYPPKPDHIIPTGIEGLLTVYFAKDYDELVEQYGKMRLITQIVAQYKEDQHPATVKHCLDEVLSLVAKEHNEKYLRDKIVNEYGVKIPISKLGGSYQIFLERLHEELVGKRLYT